MEALGALFDEGEWDAYPPQFLQGGENNESILYSLDVFNSNLQYSSNYYLSDIENVPLINNSYVMSMDACMIGENNPSSFVTLNSQIAAKKETTRFKQLQLKRIRPHQLLEPEDNKIITTREPYQNPKKKLCLGSNDGGVGTEAEEINKMPTKTRSSANTRGSATDYQSIYARKRRERINERLRILQNLVSNGTKVDISTMLEEAVQYVKFLQLQIKLLSSDDLWMYAPVVNNGV